MRYLIWIILLVLSSQSFAQSIKRSVIGALNNAQLSTTTSLHSSLGQNSISGTLTASNAILRQGFQQPLEDTTTAILIVYNPNLELVVYPNPFSDVTNITVISDKIVNYTLTLRTISGVIVWQEENIATHTVLQKNALSSAIYILELKSEEGMYQTKIVIQ